MTADLYETDFYSWTQQQADLIKSGQLDIADRENLAEEIESLGRSQESALESAYRLVSMHLLKLMYQAERETRGWKITIGTQRLHAMRLLRKNPGLKAKRLALFESAYSDAREEAALETDLLLEIFPDIAPFTLEQVEDRGFWPVKPWK